MPDASAPMVICLACGADDHPRRLAEIAALADRLGGRAVEQSVTGRTTAVQISVPVAHAPRFAAALILAGATQMEAATDIMGPDFLVLLTHEPTPPSGASS